MEKKGKGVILAIGLLATFGLAGCTDPADTSASFGASEYILARDLTVAVSAGSVWHLDFNTRGGMAQYDFRLTDDSSVDIGFIRTQNVRNFADGSTSSVYGSHNDVSSASDSTVLDGDAWSLYIVCNNAFADCDGILSYASFWT